MSAYKKIECEIVDKECLLEALSLLGFNPDVLNEPKNLKGYRGDERKEVAHLKLITKKTTIDTVEKQLTKCVNLAKYWQIQGFNRDETARTRRTQTTR